jgi:hypothetical protein
MATVSSLMKTVYSLLVLITLTQSLLASFSTNVEIRKKHPSGNAQIMKIDYIRNSEIELMVIKTDENDDGLFEHALNRFNLPGQERKGITLFCLEGKIGLQDYSIGNSTLEVWPLNNSANEYVYKFSSSGNFISSFFLNSNLEAFPLDHKIYKILNGQKHNSFIPIVLFPVTPNTSPTIKSTLSELKWELQHENGKKALEVLRQSLGEN